ncbi:MAG TPA: hypothetical protein VFG14_03170, partial [Chthoniobacteraceae bacterium]|nr:hypothetical protein [Chthoniobacteraceae bacterium]
MRLKILPSILCASIALAIAPLQAQVSNDPSDSFVTAYSAFSRAERIAESGNSQAALTAYREVARILDQISARWPGWNPAIVEFRKKRTSEAIQKLQAKGGGGRATAPAPMAGDAATGAGQGGNSIVEPELPGETSLIPDIVEPEPSLPVAPRGAESMQPGPSISVDPITEIRNRMDQLQRDLESSRSELEKVRRERDDIQTQFQTSKGAQEKAEQQQKVLQARSDNAEAALMKALAEGAKESETVKKLQTEASKAKQALRDLQIEREAAEEVRQQLASRLTNAQN